ncbi:MAG: hypothetical protein CMP23_17390 [Rickettsiales bacterium]|nr:hypothetical protein [Rickettsiales bacterium]
MSATHSGDRQRHALATLTQLARQLRRCCNEADLSLAPQVVVDLLDCYKALLYRFDPSTASLQLTASSRPQRFEEEQSRLEQGQVLAVEVLEEQKLVVSELRTLVSESQEKKLAQWVAAPIFGTDGVLLGVLEAELARAVEATERHLIQIAADLIAEHLAHADLHDRVFRSNVYLAQLNDITQQVSAEREVQGMVEAAARGLDEMMEVEELCLYLIEEAVPVLAARAGCDEQLPTQIRVVSDEGSTILGNDDDPQVSIGTGELAGSPVMTELLRTGTGGARGILLLRKAAGAGPFDPEQLPLLSALSTHLCTAVDNAALMQEIQRQATYDDLTGLVGRRHFLSEMKRERERARREERPLSLLMIDADNFKALNDNYGHPAGDAVLMALARELIKGTRAVDLVGRLGGEEVAVLLPGATNEVAVCIAERLRESIQQLEIPWNNQTLGVTVSIGVTTLSGDMSPLELLEQADQALYQAKDQGRDRVVSQYDLQPVTAHPEAPTAESPSH